MHVPEDFGKLTKRDALLLCEEMWLWLSKDGGREKEDWPRWIDNGGGVPEMWALCPCCESVLIVDVEENAHVVCDDCPITWRDGHCMEGEYIDWSDECDMNIRAEMARAIAALARAELDKEA